MSEAVVINKRRIIMVRQRISGLWGIHRLYGLVKGRIEVKPGESVDVVFFTKNSNRLKILTVDSTGVSLTTRMLYKGYFIRRDSDYEEQTELSVEELKRLMFDGTVRGDNWQNSLSKIFLQQS